MRVYSADVVVGGDYHLDMADWDKVKVTSRRAKLR